MRLSQYLRDTQSLLRDRQGLITPVDQLTVWINEARNWVAYLTGCLQTLVTGQAPFGAGAQSGSAVPGGATSNIAPTNQFLTIVRQERYPFQFGNRYVSAAGYGPIVDVVMAAVSWGSMRPALDFMPWEDLQAYARSYNYLVTSYPVVWSKDGDGENANVWYFPVPTQALEMEWMVNCGAKPLWTDDDPEALPRDFQYAVKFGAASLAYMGSQRPGLAMMHSQLFMQRLRQGRMASDAGKITRFYDYLGPV